MSGIFGRVLRSSFGFRLGVSVGFMGLLFDEHPFHVEHCKRGIENLECKRLREEAIGS